MIYIRTVLTKLAVLTLVFLFSSTPAVATFTVDLYPGMNHPQAKALQQLLNQSGYPVTLSGDGSKGMETTIMGPATVAALKRFQATNGITPTGIVGPLTRIALNARLRVITMESASTTVATNTKATSTAVTKKRRSGGGGGGGSSRSSSSGSVASPAVSAPVATFSAAPTSVTSGGAVTLTWSSTNATACTGTNFSTSNATAGSVTVNPTVSTTYTISCTGPGGTDTESRMVTIVVAYTGPFTCDPAAVTCVEITSTDSGTQTVVPVTFGQPFVAGDFMHSTTDLVATDNLGNTVPVQVDDVSSHTDGSARFAVISARVANLAAGEQRIINLYTGTNSATAQTIPANPDWNLVIEATTSSAVLIAEPQAQLVTQIAQSQGRRFAGPVATEFTVVTPFRDKTTGVQHPHLVARFHVRLYDNGNRIRTEVVIENTRTFTANPGNITYAMAIRRNGTTIHTQPSFTHYHHARWRTVLWTGGSEPHIQVRHAMQYFLNSRVVLNYNLNLNVLESRLSQLASEFAAANTDPMAPALLQTYFPTTGAREDIGPLPMWTVMYLLTQDERVKAIVLANAHAAAGVPIHFRDDVTGYPVDVQTHPNFTLGYPHLSDPAWEVTSDTTIWEPDRAHQGSFAYIPYILTGDTFYLDELMFWTSWNIAMSDAGSRNGSDGIIHYDQIRAQAWSLRSIGEAAHAVPDTHYLKNYFTNVLANNLTWYANPSRYTPLGALKLQDYPNDIVQWQNDFMMLVFSRLAENNEPNAATALNLLGQFQVGRFVNEVNGFCPSKAVGYDMRSTRTDSTYITTWNELFSRNFPTYVGTPCDEVPLNEEAYPSESSGMSAMARASLAASVTAGVPNATTAYQLWTSMTPLLTDTAFAYDPTWSVIPR